MKSGAAVFVLTDIAPEIEDDLNEWYNREHLYERVEIPGFVRARRFTALNAPRKYLCYYETENVSVLTSPAYVTSVNNPHPKTVRIVRHFENTARIIGTIRKRTGDDGGIIAIQTVEVAPADRPALNAMMAAVSIAGIVALPQIVGATLVEEDNAISSQRNAGKDLRATEDGRADWVLTIEGIDADAVARACDAALAGVPLPPSSRLERGIYRFLCGKNA